MRGTDTNHRRGQTIHGDSDRREDRSYGCGDGAYPAGHAAIPLEGNAIFRLGRALWRLADHNEPVTLTPTTRRFFSELAGIWPEPDEASAMAALTSDDSAAAEKGASILSKTPVFNAVMRNGISATGIAGGIAGNVIPAQAEAMLNVRTIPGQDIEGLVERLRARIGDPDVTVTIVAQGDEAAASDSDSPMFRAIAESARTLDPHIAVMPYLSTGVTDSARLRRMGIDAYGILPFPMVQSDEERMHGHDERVPIESLHFGTRLIFESVRRIAIAGTSED